MITDIDAHTALVLIDLQKGIATDDKAHPVDNILKNAAKLVEGFHAAGLPVVIVNVIPARAGWTRKDAPMPGILKPGTQSSLPADFAEIVPAIPSKTGDIFVTKHTWSAFYETSLHEELQKCKVTGIVLAGISTSIGVEGTARSAAERGYNISFATDAMTDRTLESHEHSIKQIFPRLGESGTTADILAHLPKKS